jgi:YD repeat-containing protein
MLFIITDKTRTIGEYVKRVSVWWEKKSWRWKMRHTKWIGGREHRRRRRWIEARGLWVGGVTMSRFPWICRIVIDVKVDTQDSVLDDRVADLIRFELPGQWGVRLKYDEYGRLWSKWWMRKDMWGVNREDQRQNTNEKKERYRMNREKKSNEHI